jgi:hypothetical protein
VSEATSFDGREVTVEGEVIGDRLHSGSGHVWINVLGDDGVGIGAWTPGEMARAVETYGDYNAVGDRVLVTGLFNAACDLHGGDLDIHVTDLTVVEPGTAVEHDVEPVWAFVGIVGIAAAVVLQRVYRSRRLRAPAAGPS